MYIYIYSTRIYHITSYNWMRINDHNQYYSQHLHRRFTIVQRIYKDLKKKIKNGDATLYIGQQIKRKGKMEINTDPEAKGLRKNRILAVQYKTM